jgi:hypothetical protein
VVTETPTRLSSLQEWLDALVLAAPADRRMVAIEGCDTGIGFARVVCDLHDDAALNWLSAFAHLDRTEGTHRLQHGAAARLHQPGDLRPTPEVRKTATCGRCRGQVIWATTSSGASIPIDADPDPAGNVVLAKNPGGDRPLAIFLHSEEQRAHLPAGSVFTRHAQSCKPKRGGRR